MTAGAGNTSLSVELGTLNINGTLNAGSSNETISDPFGTSALIEIHQTGGSNSFFNLIVGKQLWRRARRTPTTSWIATA